MSKIDGWACPPGSRKYHYFAGSDSLCGSYGFRIGGENEPDDGTPSPDDCKVCRKKLTKLQEALV